MALFDLAIAYPALPLSAFLCVGADSGSDGFLVVLIGLYFFFPVIAVAVLFKLLAEVDRRSKKRTSVRRRNAQEQGGIPPGNGLESVDRPSGRHHSYSNRQASRDAHIVVIAPPVLAGAPIGILLYAACVLASIATYLKTVPLI
jgi:hypothetical protein